ncbi:hypothetical protein ACHAXR_006614 [Thalassiosira sp. AJA248-18]
MWHLRSLAIQPGGLLNSHGRKLGWIKLAGVDDLVFDGEQATVAAAPSTRIMDAARQEEDDRRTYEQIQTQLEHEMEPSKWHIQRERRRLRKTKKKHENLTHPPPSAGVSHASSTNDLSSIGSESGSSTPLTANLNNSRAGTPKSVTFQGLGPNFAAAPFTAFSTKNGSCTDASSTTSYTSFPSITVDTTFGSTLMDTTISNAMGTPSPSSNVIVAPSPLSLSSPSPAAHPQSQFQWDLTPKSYLQHQRKYQRKQKIKPRVKKDRRPQERKFLIQIATSAFYALQSERRDETDEKLQYYPGLQDLIAIILLHLESPSLASLLLKQIVESHLWMYCAAYERDESVESFASCIDDDCSHQENIDDEIVYGSIDCNKNWDLLSLSFFPLLQTLDEELHDSLLQDGCDFLNDQVFVFGKVLHRWISCWFCCHDTLPLESVSRVVDFFLASHPAMPFYVSMAILCHPIHRDKFILLSRQFRKSSSDLHLKSQSPQSPPTSLATTLDNIFVNLPNELSARKGSLNGGTDGNTDEFSTDLSKNDDTEWVHGGDNELTADFMEQTISEAISLMKQVSPRELLSLVKDYRNGILMPYLRSGCERWTSPPSPWTKRSIAPTDYNIAQRLFSGAKVDPVNRCTISRNVVLKHQIALDASGLPASQLRTQSLAGDYWLALKSRSMKPTTAVIIGIAACIGAQLLQLKQNPSDSELLGFISEVNSADYIGVALRVPLENYSNPVQVFDEDTTNIRTALTSDNGNVESHEVPSFFVENVMDEAIIETEVELGPKLDSEPTPSYDISSFASENDQGALLDQTLQSVSSKTDTVVFHEAPPVTADADTHDPGDAMEALKDVHVEDTGWETISSNIDWPHSVQSVSESLSDSGSRSDSEDFSQTRGTEETVSNVETKDILSLADQEKSGGITPEEKRQHPFAHIANQEEIKRPKVSIHHLHKLRSRKLSARMKKRALESLVGFRDGYIALVENDDFFM